MTLTKRFALIFTGVIIFSIFAPMAIFFALGYRYDFENNRIIQTGALVIRSQPKKATVTLNDEKKGKTPLTQRFLIPGEYQLQVSKPGYFTWKKNITIHKKQALEITTSNLRKIFLLLNNSKPQIIQEDNSHYFSNQDSLYLLQTQNNQNAESTSLKVHKIDSEGNQELVAQSNEDYDKPKIINALGGEVLIKDANQSVYLTKDFLSFLPDEYTNYHLGIKPESVLGIDGEQKLFSLDLRGEPLNLVKENVQYYEVINNEIYLISKEQGSVNLSKISASGLKTPLYQNLKPSLHYDIIANSKGQIFLLLDKTLFRLTENELEQLHTNTTFARFGRSQTNLIYGNSNEVWIHYPNSPTNNTLVTRQSTPLQYPILNEEIGYVFTGNGSRLTAYELSDNNQSNIYKLTQTNNPLTPIFATITEIYYQSENTVYAIQIIQE